MKAVKVEGNASNDPNMARPSHRRLRKVNRASPPTTLELHGTRIHFPFRPYKCQEVYMQKVIEALLRSENALLESPTGTGKTLCLLCASLAWQRQQSRLIRHQAGTQLSQQIATNTTTTAAEQGGKPANSKARVPTIIYASRTHSQLSQVVRELRNTRYRPLHAVLGSRDQMCVNPKVKKPQSAASDINHECSKLGKDRRCHFKNNLEGFQAPTNEEGTASVHPIMDMEDLVEMGKAHKVCPFYYSRSHVENAELILVPYNYIFDKDIRDTTLADIPWDNSIVIFDEGHNLQSVASESASFDLSTNDVGGCVAEVHRAINFLQAEESNTSHRVKMDNLLRLKAIFLRLEDFILNLGDRTGYVGEYIMEFFQRGACITFANYELFIEEIRKVNDFIMDMRGPGANSKSSPNLEHFALCLKRVFGHPLESRCLAKAAFYQVHVSPKSTATANQKKNSNNNNNKKDMRTISYWCFAPSIAMEEIAGLKVRSIIVTSGTLSPLPSYSMELGLKFPHTLENPHIIDDDQILVRVVGKGVSGKLLSSSYERRNDGEYYSELGNTLVSLAKVVPAGMLIFYPSYSVMNTCLERWGGPVSNHPPAEGNRKSDFFAARRRHQPSNKYSFPHAPSLFYDKNCPSTPWKRLLGTKSIVVEPKTSADLPDAISEFHRYLGMPRSSGCILMGVCRGKISEGIDFSHEQSRAVVITGLPFPPPFDPKVKMQREFLDRALATSSIKSSVDGGFGSSKSDSIASKLSGNEWYTQQAHRAVNQAIGRVIRSSTDYGAVLLLDSRFDQIRNQEGLSKWLRPHIKKDEGVGATIRSLVQFYKDADAIVVEKKKAQAETVELEYEPEDDDTLTKFARVRPPNENLDCNSNDVNTNSYVAPEQIVERGDFKDVEESHRSAEPLQTSPSSKKKPDGYTSVFDAKPSTKLSAEASDKTARSQNAVKFVEMARKRFSARDGATIMKALVALNSHGQKSDVQAYTRSAREIVTLIVRHKKFASGSLEGEGNMLFLFLQLSPPVYREAVEVMALQLSFDNSAFGAQCKEILPAGCLGLARSSTVALMLTLWCKTNDEMNPTDYLVKVQEIFRLFVKEGSLPSVALKAFLKLVPSRFVAPTQTLANEVIATLKMKQMREADKAKQGALLNADHFKLPHWNNGRMKSDTDVKPTAKGINNVLKQESTPHLSARNEIASKATINPYARKRPAVDSGASSAAAAARPRKTSSLASLIKKVESDTYVKRTPADLVESLKSNAPSHIDCPICSTAAKDPFVADCGHVACLSCWRKWFKRTQTCPTCRVTTTLNSLARIVYENSAPGVNASASATGTSQSRNAATTAACDDDDDDDDDDDGELEFC